MYASAQCPLIGRIGYGRGAGHAGPTAGRAPSTWCRYPRRAGSNEPGGFGAIVGSGNGLRVWVQAVGEGGVAAAGAFGADGGGQGAAGAGQDD